MGDAVPVPVGIGHDLLGDVCGHVNGGAVVDQEAGQGADVLAVKGGELVVRLLPGPVALAGRAGGCGRGRRAVGAVRRVMGAHAAWSSPGTGVRVIFTCRRWPSQSRSSSSTWPPGATVSVTWRRYRCRCCSRRARQRRRIQSASSVQALAMTVETMTAVVGSIRDSPCSYYGPVLEAGQELQELRGRGAHDRELVVRTIDTAGLRTLPGGPIHTVAATPDARVRATPSPIPSSRSNSG